MLKIFETNAEYNTYTDNNTNLDSGVLFYVKEDETAHFSTNNIDGEYKIYDLNGGTLNPEDVIIVTSQTNAPLMTVLHSKGLAANENYMTLAEAKSVTNEQLNGLLNGNTTVINFNEFKYFTGVTKICTSDDAEASKTLSPFKGCTSLKEITLPKTVHEFGARAFDLTKNVNIINGLENVHKFAHCSLQGTFGNSSTQNFDYIRVDELLGGNNFNNVYKATNGYGIKKLEISEGIEEIGTSAFFKLYNLEEIKLPNSLKIIGGITSNTGACFAGCKNLKRLNSNIDGVINIPNGVTTIGWQAFYCTGSSELTGNNQVKEINIPDSVETLGNSAFGGYYKCERINIGKGIKTMEKQCIINAGRDTDKPLVITIKAKTPPTWTAEDNITVDKVKIYVPVDSVLLYKAAAGWSNYASVIEGK